MTSRTPDKLPAGGRDIPRQYWVEARPSCRSSPRRDSAGDCTPIEKSANGRSRRPGEEIRRAKDQVLGFLNKTFVRSVSRERLVALPKGVSRLLERNQADFDSSDHSRDSICRAQLACCVAKMEFDRFFGNDKDFSDFPVRLSLLAPCQALDFLAGEDVRSFQGRTYGCFNSDRCAEMRAHA